MKNKLHLLLKDERDARVQMWLGKAQMEGSQNI